MGVLEEKIKFTYEDYLHLPDDGKRYQIIEGELFVVPAPIPYHQDILGNLLVILRNFVDRHKLGKVYCAPCDIILSNEDVVQPDIFFISEERKHIISDKNIQGTPDFIVEILSPYTLKLDKIQKRKLYQRFKVKEYWLVDPERKEVEALVLKGEDFESLGVFRGGDSFESPLLKGLRLGLKDIFK